jgi:flotillin
MFNLSLGLILLIAIPVLIILMAIVFLIGYTKATPDEAKIISGLHKNPKTIIGKAGFRWPLLERVDSLSLKLISVDVKTSSSVPTANYININVDSVVNIQVSKNPELILLAERNFLNKDEKYICSVAREVLEGNMREIVGKMTLEDMVSDRQKFAELVKENAGPDLAAMGLDIISFNVQNFIDDNHVIENLGVDNIVKIQKQAAISRAESEREIAQAQALSRTEIAKAEANKDLEIAKVKADTEMQARQASIDANMKSEQKQAEADLAIRQAKIDADKNAKSAEIEAQFTNDKARVEAETQMVIKENEKALKQAELEAKTNAERARADSAYAIQEQEQRKDIETATAAANLVKLEKQVELTKKQAEIQEQKLDAEIKKQADAEKYAIQQKADAELYERQKQAEADKYEREQNATADLTVQQKRADAQKYQLEKDAEAKVAQSEAEKKAKENAALAEQSRMEAEAVGKKALADAIKAQGEAEADATQAKLLAEAEGIKQKGIAEAESLRLKLVGEAEGISQKADAQKKMGEASILEMELDAVKVYFQQLPDMAAAMSKPLENIDKITMYGEGDVSKFMSGVTSTFKQVTDSMGAAGGLNVQSLISSFFGNKLAGATTGSAIDAATLTEVGKQLFKGKTEGV